MKTTRRFLSAAISIVITFTLSCSSDDGDGDGGNTGGGGGSGKGNDINNYKTVKIGDWIWMAQNLNYKTPNGTSRCYPISGTTNPNDDDNTNCDKYGRLYDWQTANSVCPSGWRLPSRNQWENLSSYVQNDKGCSDCDAKHLKAKSGWNNNGNGLDSYGFSALPGGGYASGIGFTDVGSYGSWWTDDGLGGNSRSYYFKRLDYNNDKSAAWGSIGQSALLSVRCVKKSED